MPRESYFACVDPSDPQARGQCDRGGEIRRLSDLRQEMSWRGNRLVWNGFLVCDKHRDPPQPQDRTYRLRPDPVPVARPRAFLPWMPLPDVLSDGIPTATETQNVVFDQWNRPLRDDYGTDDFGVPVAPYAPVPGLGHLLCSSTVVPASSQRRASSI